MAYCAKADILNLMNNDTLIALTDQDVPAVTIDDAVLSAAIKQSDNLIDSYLGGLYTVPLVTIPDLVKDISVDITIYNLYARRPEAGMVPELAITRYKDRIKTLEGITTGTLSLPGTTPAAGSSAGSYKTNKSSTDRVFGSSTWGKY